MPLEAYRCNDCEHEFETRQRMADDPLTDCPVCDGSIRRVINKVGVVFKGSGFYVTDNKGKNPAAPVPDADGDSAGKNGSGPEKEKSESSADAKKGEKSESAPKAEKKSEKASA